MRVLITGANRGVGAALLEGYRRRGDDALGTARGAPGFVPLDVGDPASVASLPDRVTAPIDTLVCNAGVYLEKGLTPDRYTPEMWAQSFAVNVTGVFLTVRAMLEHLSGSDRPRIAIISSQMASSERAPGGSYIYRASKAAVLNLGRNLAQDLKSSGIAVGIYHPGWVRTDMGGSAADISAAEAAAGLMARIDALSLDTTGCFETWDGRAHPF